MPADDNCPACLIDVRRFPHLPACPNDRKDMPGSAVADATELVTGDNPISTPQDVIAEMVAYMSEGMNTAHIHRDGTVAGGPMCTEYDQECIVLTDKRARELANTRRETFRDLMNRVDKYSEGTPDNRPELVEMLTTGFKWKAIPGSMVQYISPDKGTILVLDDIEDNDVTVTRMSTPTTTGWKASMTRTTPTWIMLQVAFGRES